MSGDEALDVSFYVNAVPHEGKSAEEGRPIYMDVEYIKIVIPGTKNEGANRPVREDDKKRFPRHYAAFKEGLAEQVIGTPLEELVSIPVSRRAELKAQGIKTVEMLAGVSDTTGPKLGMGWLDNRKVANEYLTAAKERGGLDRVLNENKQLKQDLEILQAQLVEVNKRFQALEKQKK